MPAPDHLLRIDVELLTRTYPETPDGDGVQVPAVVAEATCCELQQVSAREDLGGAVQLTSYRLVLPADKPARGWDAIRRVDSGELYELEGEAWQVVNPRTGVASHVEAFVRRAE
jgi:hypothetical protein